MVLSDRAGSCAYMRPLSHGVLSDGYDLGKSCNGYSSGSEYQARISNLPTALSTHIESRKRQWNMRRSSVAVSHFRIVTLALEAISS